MYMISWLFYATGCKIPTYVMQLMIPIWEPFMNMRAPMMIVHGISPQARARCMLIKHGAALVHRAERVDHYLDELLSAGWYRLHRLAHGCLFSGTLTEGPACSDVLVK